MLQDPDGFQSAVDKEDEAAAIAVKQQEEEDERIAREFNRENRRRVEEDRQRIRHEEERRRARAEQEKEKERKEKNELMKRRQKEDTLSLATVKKTTKACPGCQWPIEKNEGCSHMTCKSSFSVHTCDQICLSAYCGTSSEAQVLYPDAGEKSAQVTDWYRHTMSP